MAQAVRKLVIRHSTLIDIRDNAMQAIIQNQIQLFLEGKVEHRNCGWCGGSFKPTNRYNFFCEEGCRNQYYGGQIMPRRK